MSDGLQRIREKDLETADEGLYVVCREDMAPIIESIDEVYEPMTDRMFRHWPARRLARVMPSREENRPIGVISLETRRDGKWIVQVWEPIR